MDNFDNIEVRHSRFKRGNPIVLTRCILRTHAWDGLVARERAQDALRMARASFVEGGRRSLADLTHVGSSRFFGVSAAKDVDFAFGNNGLFDILGVDDGRTRRMKFEDFARDLEKVILDPSVSLDSLNDQMAPEPFTSDFLRAVCEMHGAYGHPYISSTFIVNDFPGDPYANHVSEVKTLTYEDGRTFDFAAVPHWVAAIVRIAYAEAEERWTNDRVFRNEALAIREARGSGVGFYRYMGIPTYGDVFAHTPGPNPAAWYPHQAGALLRSVRAGISASKVEFWGLELDSHNMTA